MKIHYRIRQAHNTMPDFVLILKILYGTSFILIYIIIRACHNNGAGYVDAIHTVLI